jgi:hypothetical protein
MAFEQSIIFHPAGGEFDDVMESDVKPGIDFLLTHFTFTLENMPGKRFHRENRN